MFFLVVHFREYARNTVYNYVLANNIYLLRLIEKPISALGLHKAKIYGVSQTFKGYVIAPQHDTEGGYIIYKKVSWVEYQLVFWFLWGWIDDDSMQDTMCYKFNQSIMDKKRKTWLPKWAIKEVQKAVDGHKVKGNTFDIGDRRSENPEFNWVASTLWIMRNSAYNFKYMQYEMKSDNKDLFLVTILGYKFGWEKDKYPDNYNLVVFGK